jgi:hypothetical protein
MRDTTTRNLHFEYPKMDLHKYAIIKLAGWTGGLIEYPLWLDDNIIFTPDVSCFQDGNPSRIYQVTDSNGITGKELGLMQYYCYRKGIDFTVYVYEISVNYIISLTERPFFIKPDARYIIDPFNIEDNF